MGNALKSSGLGDSIAKVTKWFGIEPCNACEERRKVLNRWLPYSRAPSTQLVSTSNIIVRSETLIVASSGGSRREPGRSGPLDWEGDRREGRRQGSSSSPSATNPEEATSFACGIDVTEATKAAIRITKSEFGKLSVDRKHEACSALHGLRTGEYAWDILDLHSQVTSDALNKPFRPPCATSGASPACGSSIQIGGSCHFAGSANYVIFGIMCKLCSDYYNKMMEEASWYEFIDKDTYRMGVLQFSVDGMLGLIDLYKKYVPMLTGGSPARNIDAAKRWSMAGWNGWPHRVATPPGDRSNCTTTCPHQAAPTFQVSWYPFLNPYQSR